MKQVENFEEYSETAPESKVISFTESLSTQKQIMVAEDITPYGIKNEIE